MDLVAISIASDIVAITEKIEFWLITDLSLLIVSRSGVKSIIEQSGIKIHYPLKEETIFSRVISIPISFLHWSSN